MVKIPQISANDLIKVLRKSGFDIISQRGSHIKLRKINSIRKTIIVPNHKIIRPGTLNNILKMTEISKAKLRDLLK